MAGTTSVEQPSEEDVHIQKAKQLVEVECDEVALDRD
jgi:hypothetical protein